MQNEGAPRDARCRDSADVMADRPDAVAVQQLADGFKCLCGEYKALADRYRELERNLRAANKEYESLRTLIPERLRQTNFALPAQTEDTKIKENQSIVEYLEEFAGNDSGSRSDAIAHIRDAESALQKLTTSIPASSEHLDETNKATTTSMRSGGRQGLERKVRVEIRNSNNDNQGPRCPFASAGGPMPADHPPVPPNIENTHTPRSSRSLSRSKRLSFHDPLKPDMSQLRPISPARSTSSGPACPIRFLGDHSPEEIAQYFEEHKHELPRSHELCIRRFQDNAQSIRELDEKYGNLVSMIKGLGEKHQPMLPTEPASQDSQNLDHDSNQKIKEWAKTVSDCGQPQDLPSPDSLDVEAVDETVDVEREQRFDRPLKDVRVGESPSRPWGVQIPAKYLDRTPSSGSNVSDAAKEVAPPTDDAANNASKTEVKPVAVPIRKALDRRVSNQSRHSEAPSMMARMTEHNVSRKKIRYHKPGMFNHLPNERERDEQQEDGQLTRHKKGIFVNDGATVEASEAPEKPSGPRIVNRGLAVISDSKSLGTCSLVNHGTLVIGYSDDELKQLDHVFL